MALMHEFVLVEEVPEDIDYRNFTEEEMTLISDDFVQKYYKITEKVEMYFDDLSNKDTGLNYHGETILDNEMAANLKAELIAHCKPCEDLAKLVAVIDQAIAEKKYIIHFGI